jgi:peptidoglycan/xylan/chitin deacetylase (PgdA/CDA1 family)
MLISHRPISLNKLVKSVLWRVPAKGQKKKVYLTFDDGPHPYLTPWVMAQLKDAGNFKATFFCVGENALEHPDLLQQLRDEGHEVANHSNSHESGWSTSIKSYLRSFLKCEHALGNTNKFRPPYGRITPPQANALSSRTQVVMWDVLSGDCNRSNSGADCLKSLKQLTRAGSIVVFHDSDKAASRLLYALPAYLKWLKKNGYHVDLLPEKATSSEVAGSLIISKKLSTPFS